MVVLIFSRNASGNKPSQSLEAKKKKASLHLHILFVAYHSYNLACDPPLLIFFWDGFIEVDDVALDDELVEPQPRHPVHQVPRLVWSHLKQS